MKYVDYEKNLVAVEEKMVEAIEKATVEVENGAKWKETVGIFKDACEDVVSVKKSGKIIILGLIGEGYQATWKYKDGVFEQNEIVAQEEAPDIKESEEDELPELHKTLAGFVEDNSKILEKGVLYIVNGDKKEKSDENCVINDDNYKVYMTKTNDARLVSVADKATGMVFFAKFDKTEKVDKIKEAIYNG